MPNPLTDELSDEAKAELAAMFADMRARFNAIYRPEPRRSRLPAVATVRTGW